MLIMGEYEDEELSGADALDVRQLTRRAEYMDHGSLYDLLHNETMAIEGELILPLLKDITQVSPSRTLPMAMCT